MKQRDRDDLLARVARVGKNAPLPKGLDPQTSSAIDSLQRQIGELSAAQTKATEHVFQGPLFAKGSGQTFVIDARASSSGFNILTTAKATQEGLPAWNGFVSIKHGLNVVLDRWVVVDWTLKTPAATQPTSMGWIRRYASDLTRTVFQITADAQSQEVLAIVTLYAQVPPPRGAEFARAPEAVNRLAVAADIAPETIAT